MARKIPQYKKEGEKNEVQNWYTLKKKKKKEHTSRTNTERNSSERGIGPLYSNAMFLVCATTQLRILWLFSWKQFGLADKKSSRLNHYSVNACFAEFGGPRARQSWCLARREHPEEV